MKPFGDLITAVQFLSRLPIPNRWASHEKPDFSKQSWAFPLAGGLIALPQIGVLLSLTALSIDPLVSAVLAVATYVVTTGMLHEDGLADTADGFGGGYDKDRKLDIMKDSRVGAYGVIALVLILIAHIAVISSLMNVSHLGIILILVSAHAFSRLMVLAHWHFLPAAREGGLAKSFGIPERKTLAFAAMSCLPFLALLIYSEGLLSSLISIVVAIVVTALFSRFCLHQINGHTGDTIGATQILSYLAFLIPITT